MPSAISSTFVPDSRLVIGILILNSRGEMRVKVPSTSSVGRKSILTGTKFWNRNGFGPILEHNFEGHPDSYPFRRAFDNVGHHLRSLFQSDQRDHVRNLVGESGRYRPSYDGE